MTPQRIQRKRAKGWKMPEGAVYVGRPGGFGNPFKAGEGKWLRGEDDSRLYVVCHTPQDAVDSFRWFVSEAPERLAAIKELAGKDLACWCPLDRPCHADVLLELANGDNR